jgi:hypothetical protein
MNWNAREMTVAEAARVAGLHRTHLDVIINRNKPIAVLFSERRKGRRWFSARDVAVLRIAYELERAGRNWLTAIGQAYEHTAAPPPPDALLVIPALSVSAMSGRVLTAFPALPCTASMIVLPIGKIAAEVVAAFDLSNSSKKEAA